MSDFIVIGGGIAGLSAGARLSQLGKVTLLEGESALGYHASGRSAALFEENYGSACTVGLNKASAEYHRAHNGGYLSRRGLMIVAGRADRAAFERDVAALGVTPITPQEARDMVPVLDLRKVDLAGHHEGAYDIDTDRMLQDFAKAIRANGGTIVTQARVSQITRTANGWRVETEGGVYSGAQLVNAAGAWADQIAALAGIPPIGIIPHRRSMARIPAPGGLDVSNWPMFFGPGEAWYAKPDAGALLVSPAEEHPVEAHDAWADDMVLAEGLARYEHYVAEPVTRLLASWAGLRSFAPDRNLVLGLEASDPAFIWCAGQGGYGFQTAPAASQLIADLVNGSAPELPDDLVAALSPARFA